MTTTEQVSVRAITARVLDETSLNDPREIAEKVAAMIPPAEQFRILVDALVSEVRSVMSERRNRALSNAFKPVVDVPVVGGSIQTAPKRQPNRSRKVEGIRDWWADVLSSRVHVGGSQWMVLGQCGVKELEFAEKERRDLAAREVGRAKQYMRLRELLDQYEVATVAELPADAAKAAWS
ncbi:hypothetical protein IU443_28585 [Nocardia farcinica]|uniref:hypothetical protein n=1 Tax=Nocardia farcinica TaxID=37329 RepID=UPI001893EF30|nr:hypothetical protein [Nocardia farcinica]MBF6393890.1 hypothetical protein [Nocardia farcinica]MBF6540750.1 hypothetical protein [Nocardia farcinica]